MNLLNFSAWFLGFLVLCDGLRAILAELNNNAKNCITWDDMEVDDYILHIRDEGNGSKVIVVDKNGRGNSLTVQGAVDMVPENNADRVKIYILPGVYRSVFISHFLKISPFFFFFVHQENIFHACSCAIFIFVGVLGLGTWVLRKLRICCGLFLSLFKV